MHGSTQFLCPRGKGHACGLCPGLLPHSSHTEVTVSPCPMLCNSNGQRMAAFRFIPVSTMPLACHMEKGCGRTIDKACLGPGIRALHRPYAVSPWSVVSSSSMVWASRHPTGRAACMCCSWGRCRVLSNLAGSPVIGRMEGVSKTQRAGPPNHCRQCMVQ